MVSDVDNPYMGDEEFSFDLSMGYSKRFDKVNWQIQLNLLPRSPMRHAGLELAGISEPSSRVGGARTS